MRRHLSIRCIVPLAFLVLAGCDSEHLSESSAHAREALEELREFGLEMKDELLNKVEDRRAEIERAAKDLRQRFENDDELRESLERKRVKVQEALDALRTDSREAWESTRDSLIDATDDLEEFVRGLR